MVALARWIAASIAGKISSPFRSTSARLPATSPESVWASIALTKADSPTLTSGAR